MLELLGIARRIEKYEAKVYTHWAIKPIFEEFSKQITYAFGLTSKKFPTVKTYVKSDEFKNRLTISILFAVAVLIGSAATLISSIAGLFYNSLPSSIATTTIGIFTDSSGGAFHMASVRLGGTLFGNVLGFLLIEIIIRQANEYLITIFTVLVVSFFAFVAVDFKEVASVSSFVFIAALWAIPQNSSDYDT